MFPGVQLMTVEHDGNAIVVRLEFYGTENEGVRATGAESGSIFVPPSLGIRVASDTTLRRRLSILVGKREHDQIQALNGEQRELLLFTAGRWAQTEIDLLLTEDETGTYELRFIEANDARTFIQHKELAAGETYEQRSTLCFEDACQIVRRFGETL